MTGPATSARNSQSRGLAGAQEPHLWAAVYSPGADGKGRAPYIPPLAGNPVALDGDPSSLINLVLNGAEPLVVKGTPDAYRMPQYRVQLTDDEIAQVLTFVRSAWGNGAASVTADQVKALRPVTDPSSDRVIILKMR
jgi:alcohol dehydrogenase (quinone), cytochrome c subunit